MDAVLQHRLERGQPIACRLTQALVPPDDLRLARQTPLLVVQVHIDGHDLPVEAAFGPGRRRLALRGHPERVGLIAGYAAHPGDPSAAWNWLGESYGQSSSQGRPGPGRTLAPSGTRLMASTPHPIPTSIAPAAIRPATR